MGTTTCLELEPVDGPKLEPIRLTKGENLRLGRAEDCSVVLPDETVSRHHTAIDENGSCWCVRDLGSRNGTYLNGVRLELEERLALSDGDLVRIGVWTLVVRLTEKVTPAAAVPPPPPSSSDAYATRATIFLRLGAEASSVRELGWQDFADRYGPIIVGFARNAGLSTQDADDILQDVLMGFFRVSDALEYDPKKGRFRGYLKRATLNAIRARWRKEKHDARAGLEQDVAGANDLDAMWDWEWMEQTLRRALGEARTQFEPATFEAFELYGVRGVSAAAVAERLGMSADAVRHAKSRVARALRETIERIRLDDG